MMHGAGETEPYIIMFEDSSKTAQSGLERREDI